MSTYLDTKLNKIRSRTLNNDGCCYESNRHEGLGGIFRNEEGRWSVQYYGKFTCINSLEAELWAIYRGVTIILKKGMSQVKIESNSLQAVQLVHKGAPPNCIQRALMDKNQQYTGAYSSDK